jgi:hypothetical protein
MKRMLLFHLGICQAHDFLVAEWIARSTLVKILPELRGARAFFR